MNRLLLIYINGHKKAQNLKKTADPLQATHYQQLPCPAGVA